MRPVLKFIWTIMFVASSLAPLNAQDLSPRAYVITALHSNAVILTYSYYSGSVLFNGVAPITGATGTYSVPIFTYYHSFGMFGRSSNLNVAIPYGIGTFQGEVGSVNHQIYRSGLLDTTLRLSVNLKGGPAMPAQEYVKWTQKALIGVSLKVVAPTGQYDPNKLINWGGNRWAFKPELGYSRRRGHVLLDAYGGVWFYTTNQRYYSPLGPQPQTEKPIGSFEGHLGYDFKPRLWFSLDGNFWFGGVTSLSGIQNLATRQTSSRIGVTASVPLGKHQSIKFSYADGAYVRFGGNYQSVSAAWQYSWLGLHP
ncbi:MAG TPA: transporter [Edaphobacter sp.]|nr:transporter [Edaphobacter sp.]